MSTLILGWDSLPSQLPRSLPAHIQTRKSFLTSWVGTLSLYFSGKSASSSSFVLGISGWEQNFNFTFDQHQLSSTGAGLTYLLLQDHTHTKKSLKIWKSLRTNLILLKIRHTKLLLCLHIPFCELLIYSFGLFFLGYSICMVFHIIHILLFMLLE